MSFHEPQSAVVEARTERSSEMAFRARWTFRRVVCSSRAAKPLAEMARVTA
ncbi:MAG: hypothetical protein HYY21_02480 [Candidatus Tectomicrobia bacterium]|nr:hypothetical protein [Candidatus Tectomicrobia bacterium]